MGYSLNNKRRPDPFRIICAAVCILCFVYLASRIVYAQEPDMQAAEEPAAWNDGVDYLSLIDTVLQECGDDGMDVARILETRRNQKIRDLKLPVDETSICLFRQSAEQARKAFRGYRLLRCRNYTQEDLMILSSLIWVEAGDNTLPYDWKFCVGEVALNRVLDDDFPNTLKEVVCQKNQYDYYWAYKYQSPSPICVDIAQKLLEGERMMEPSVVFQSGVIQGSGIYKALYSPTYGYTYLCYK